MQVVILRIDNCKNVQQRNYLMVTTFLKQLAKNEAAASCRQLLGNDEPTYIHTLGNIPYKEEKYPGPS